MLITPIKFAYNKNYNSSISKPINSTKKNTPIGTSFCGHIPNRELLNIGYRPITINNNKIANQEPQMLIDTPQKFLALISSPEAWDKKIVLSGDLDLNGATITPIGNALKPFTGEFNGNSYKIKNFKIKSKDADNIGVFGNCENAKLTDIDVSEAYLDGRRQVGGIVGSATNSEFTNCFFNGYIEGEKCLGGLVGQGNYNTIRNCATEGTIKSRSSAGQEEETSESNCTVGGLIGSDKESQIRTSYSYASLVSNNEAGGFIGSAYKSNIQNSCYDGKISCENNAGGLIGTSTNANIYNSYAYSNKDNFAGTNYDSSIINSYANLDDITTKPSLNWDSNIWKLSIDKLPRIHSQVDRLPADKIFLEDVNVDIKTGLIGQRNFNNTVNVRVKVDLRPPRHFSVNDARLNEIKGCTDTSTLRTMFGEIVLDTKNKIDKRIYYSENDELLLEFVKNPKMDMNTQLAGTDGGYYNVRSTPLFIITCLNKAYILQQALKRDDIVFEAPSGYGNNLKVLNQAITNHIDDAAYVLLTEPKMQEIVLRDIDTFKAQSNSNFVKILLELYPNIPEYNGSTDSVEFSREFEAIPDEMFEKLAEVSTINDIQRNIDIDKNYKDSNGNNLANISTTLENEEEALKMALGASMIGTDLNNLNQRKETPIGHSIYKNMIHLTALLLKKVTNPFMRIADGTDAMLLFSNYQNEAVSIDYMESARKLGLSVNSRDNQGNTPLINAVKLKQHDKIKYLLSNGANPNLCDNAKQAPLHFACINNDKDAVKLLLDSYAYPNIKDELESIPFDYLDDDAKIALAPAFEDKNYLYELSGINSDYEFNYKTQNLDTLDMIQYQSGFLALTSKLINSDVNLDSTMLNLSKNAILNYDIKAFRTQNNSNLLHIAATSKSYYSKEVIKGILEKGLLNSTNSDNETPLNAALNAYICAGTSEEKVNFLQNIKLLLDAGPDVDIVDKNKQNALHKVCQTGNVILLNEILKHNPKLNQADVLGKMPFDYVPSEVAEPMYLILEQYLKNNKIIKEEK